MSELYRPDGQIQFRVNLPKLNTDWMAGAFSVDRNLGLSIMQRPYLFSGTRRFYMTLEVPEEAVWGEQLGARICLFNNWNYWIEVSFNKWPTSFGDTVAELYIRAYFVIFRDKVETKHPHVA